jgi:hypothetical protein
VETATAHGVAEHLRRAAHLGGLSVIGAIVGDFFFQQGEVGMGVLIDHYRARLQSEQLFAAVILAACSSGVGDTGQPTAGAGGSSDPRDLRGVCPSTIVVQTSWTPTIELDGALYALLGPNPQIDAKNKRVTAPLTAQWSTPASTTTPPSAIATTLLTRIVGPSLPVLLDTE